MSAEFADLQTLRCSLSYEREGDVHRWRSSEGTIEVHEREGSWWGPYLDWNGSRSVAHEGLRAVVEVVMDAHDDDRVIQLERDAVDDDWYLRRLGFEKVWARKKPGLWGFDRDRAHGSGENGLDGLIVSLSGGGIRACGFSAGVFELLHELELDTSIRCVTAVSGGAIFAGAWAARGDIPYASFADRLERFIVGVRDGDSAPVTHGPLVRRYADLMDRELLDRRRMGQVRGDPEVVLQTTELTRAGSFVFATGGRVRQGSPGKLTLTDDLGAKVRVADAVAASAAYPVGFEPFVFPRDFELDGADQQAAVECIRQAKREGRWPTDAVDGVPLVDGGVFDNQGIHAALNAARRHGDADLLVLVDVAVTDPVRSIWTPGQVEPDASVAMGLTAGVAILLLVGWVVTTVIPGWWIVLLTLAAFVGAMFAVPWLVLRKAREALPPEVSLAGLGTPLAFIHGVGLRLQVAMVLLTDVFMGRIRALHYREVFDQDPTPPAATVHLQDLLRFRDAREGTIRASFLARYPMAGGAFDAVQRAINVPTVLHLPGERWEREATYRAIVEAGRHTAAAKILFTLHRLKRPRSKALRDLMPRLAAVVAQAVEPSGT